MLGERGRPAAAPARSASRSAARVSRSAARASASSAATSETPAAASSKLPAKLGAVAACTSKLKVHVRLVDKSQVTTRMSSPRQLMLALLPERKPTGDADGVESGGDEHAEAKAHEAAEAASVPVGKVPELTKGLLNWHEVPARPPEPCLV